jgi:phosphoribosyl 1,2-cyclic phosphodiesterase
MKFCSLFSGSSGNCNFISTGNTNILVDAGLSGKRIQGEMDKIEADPKTIDGIFVTHEHSDHIQGVGILSRRFDLPIYASRKTWDAMICKLGKINEENIRYIEADKAVDIKDLSITPFNISHDAVEPFGFNVTDGVKKISLLTDTGCINDYIRNMVANFDLLLLETNHDVELLKVGSYPWSLKRRVMGEYGHLSNETAGEFLVDVMKGEGECVYLGHLSKENNFPELAKRTVTNILVENKINIDKEIIIEMTHRDRCSSIKTL